MLIHQFSISQNGSFPAVSIFLFAVQKNNITTHCTAAFASRYILNRLIMPLHNHNTHKNVINISQRALQANQQAVDTFITYTTQK